MRLDVDESELAACVSCGLCLPHCPTYRVTGEEAASPRGRIAAMRAEHAVPEAPSREFRRFMELCIQCRGCEAACPSAVPFGRLMEGARRTLAGHASFRPPLPRRSAYALLGHHRTLLAASSALALLQRLRLVPRRFGVPKLSLRRPRLRGSGSDAWLFTGCVMDAWMRPVHVASLDLMTRAGCGVSLPEPNPGCCGALHLHAGLHDRAMRLAQKVVTSMPGDEPVVVNSAGCGAAMSDYGELLGTEEARRFSARVVDVNHWLADHRDALPAPARRFPGPVAVQDPCHLRHVSGDHHHVRTVLAEVADLVELADEGLCCGAGGAYAVSQRRMSEQVRRLKVAAVTSSGADTVASANPGCIMHLSAAGLDVRHPVEILAWAVEGPADRD